MIYTLTLNPSVDYIVSVDPFEIGQTNRTNAEMKNPGGKGINVSRVLNNFDIKTKALGFVGGFTGGFIKKELIREGLETDFIEVEGDTRINVKLRTSEETEINGQSPLILSRHISSLKAKIRLLKEGDILVLAGSVPDSMPQSIYYTILKEVDGKGIKVIVDTSGEPLVDCLVGKPFLIKPNHHELAEVFGKKHVSIKETVSFGKQLIDKGVQNIIVSMAGDGALFINRNHVLFGNVPKGKVKNSVGAGDSVVAGFIASYIQHQHVQEAFRYGIAAGSATAYSDGFCEKKIVEQFSKEVELKKI